MKNIKIRFTVTLFTAMMVILVFSLMSSVSAAEFFQVTANEATLGKAIENDPDDIVYSEPQLVKASIDGDSIKVMINEDEKGAGKGVVCIIYEGKQVAIHYTVTASGTAGSETYSITQGEIVKWSKKPCAVINYEKETLYLVGLGEDEVNGSVYYALKANKEKEEKNKYYPIFVKSTPTAIVEINISKYIPKKQGKEYIIAMRFAESPVDVAYITIPGRPDSPAKGSVPYTDGVLSSGSVSGIEVMFGLGEYIPLYTEAKEAGEDTAAVPAKNELNLSPDSFPFGASGTARFAATASEFASSTIKIKINSMPKAPKLTIETKGFKIGPVDDRGRATSVDMNYIKGVKSADSHQVLLPKDQDPSDEEIVDRDYADKSESASWIKVPYDATNKAAFVRELKKAIKDASYGIKDEKKVAVGLDDSNYNVHFQVDFYPLSSDGKNYVIPFRTASTGKSIASAILHINIPTDMFKAPAVTAALEAKDITATENTQFSGTLKITLKNGEFNEDGELGITLSAGSSALEIASVDLTENNTVATLTLGGTAVTTAKTDIEVKIPKEAFVDEDGAEGSADITVKNAGKTTVTVTAAAAN